ncbi:MAG: anthranilate phosphoribosyltransferase family protein [Prochlorothrix sp.]|nr:anthranilate phosphoribosyltransferase family protein [Prochlorothrix sp.]
MSHLFRELLQKVGSGTHTNKALTRAEAALALELMWTHRATPAQIGAFLIAHRIRRPTVEELAGMLDTYYRFGPRLAPITANHPVLVMGVPYDGRSRTAPLAPLTALVLAAAGCPVVQHGAAVMPTKYGLPLVKVWELLGVHWRDLTLEALQHLLQVTHVGFLYIPRLFPLSTILTPYREEIGKRPPLATLELMWSPYGGESLLAMGYVHPPTETLIRGALGLHHVPRYLLVKGLEGSPDLPRDRKAIIGIFQAGAESSPSEFTRLTLSARAQGLAGTDAPLTAPAETRLGADLMQVITGEVETELGRSVIWNSGFYLWQVGAAADLNQGMAQAEALLRGGQVQAKQQELIQEINRISG